MPLVCVVVRFWTSKNGEKKTTDKQTDMATSGTEKDKNTKHAQIKSAVQKTEKTQQMSRQTCADLVSPAYIRKSVVGFALFRPTSYCLQKMFFGAPPKLPPPNEATARNSLKSSLPHSHSARSIHRDTPTYHNVSDFWLSSSSTSPFPKP